MSFRPRRILPLLGAVPLAGAFAAIAFALQSSLNLPSPGSLVASSVVAQLERVATVRAVMQLPGTGTLHTTCSTLHHVDRLFVGNRLLAVIRGARFVTWTGKSSIVPPASVVTEAELAGCPGFLVDQLTHRLRLGIPSFRRRTRVAGGSGYILRAQGPYPVVEVTVSLRSLQPLRIHVMTPRLDASATVLSASTSALTPRPPTTRARFLKLAEAGLARTERAFWNPSLHWYDENAAKAWDPPRPLARLWAAFPLFEALDAVALADPTAANIAAVNAFSRGAERYFNPDLEPLGGYEWYPGITDPREHTYFDDNGWWELSYLDAYRATGNPRDLTDAERAFRFIAREGWDPRSGGTWWETLHRHKTSEPLAAEIYAGFALYQLTGGRTYYTTALRYLRWADRYSWNAAEQLYGRSPTDGTVLDYVEGMMIGAQIELCEIRNIPGPCPRAEALARASVAEFPRYADWTPAADVVYLRFLLGLYRDDGNQAWYGVVYRNARRALVDARSPDHLYFKHWNGKLFPGRLLQPDAATLSLFAWLGGTAGPH